MYADTSCVEKPEKRTREEKGPLKPTLYMVTASPKTGEPVTFLQVEESMSVPCQLHSEEEMSRRCKSIGLISIPRKLPLPMAAVRYPFFLQEGWHRAPWRGGTGGGLPKCPLCEHELVRRTSRATQGLLWYWVCGRPSHSPLPLLLFPLHTFFIYWFVCAGPTWA